LRPLGFQSRLAAVGGWGQSRGRPLLRTAQHDFSLLGWPVLPVTIVFTIDAGPASEVMPPPWDWTGSQVPC